MKNWNLNRYFQACTNCVAPKRHEGCHASCKEHAEEKAAYEKVKESQKKDDDIAALCKESFDRTCRYHGIKRKEKVK